MSLFLAVIVVLPVAIAVTVIVFPVVAEIVTESMFERVSTFKRRMMELGAIKSLMSGSGPTVFGIFNSYFKALNCKKVLKKEYNDSFIYVSRPI